MPAKFERLTGAAAPFLQKNLNTQTIAPGKRPGDSDGGHRHMSPETSEPVDLFTSLRFNPEGEEIPEFVLNRPEFRAAKVLVVGENFGCGSSREAAVWALNAFGIRCVVAPSFGEIFANNCYKNGVLSVVLPSDEVQRFADEAAPGAPTALFTVDLTTTEITTPSGRTVSFSIPAFRREQLLEGADEVELSVRRGGEIDAYHAAVRAQKPWRFAVDGAVNSG
ncbi:3-isopropylmalate dehydratase small subunit [Nitrospinota bacterium]